MENKNIHSSSSNFLTRAQWNDADQHFMHAMHNIPCSMDRRFSVSIVLMPIVSIAWHPHVRSFKAEISGFLLRSSSEGARLAALRAGQDLSSVKIRPERQKVMMTRRTRARLQNCKEGDPEVAAPTISPHPQGDRQSAQAKSRKDNQNLQMKGRQPGGTGRRLKRRTGMDGELTADEWRAKTKANKNTAKRQKRLEEKQARDRGKIPMVDAAQHASLKRDEALQLVGQGCPRGETPDAKQTKTLRVGWDSKAAMWKRAQRERDRIKAEEVAAAAKAAKNTARATTRSRGLVGSTSSQPSNAGRGRGSGDDGGAGAPKERAVGLRQKQRDRAAVAAKIKSDRAAVAAKIKGIIKGLSADGMSGGGKGGGAGVPTERVVGLRQRQRNRATVAAKIKGFTEGLSAAELAACGEDDTLNKVYENAGWGVPSVAAVRDMPLASKKGIIVATAPGTGKGDSLGATGTACRGIIAVALGAAQPLRGGGRAIRKKKTTLRSCVLSTSIEERGAGPSGVVHGEDVVGARKSPVRDERQPHRRCAASGAASETVLDSAPTVDALITIIEEDLTMTWEEVFDNKRVKDALVAAGWMSPEKVAVLRAEAWENFRLLQATASAPSGPDKLWDEEMAAIKAQIEATFPAPKISRKRQRQ